MAKRNKQSKSSSSKKSRNEFSKIGKVGVGVGMTAATLAAVGGYFLYGSQSAVQNRKKARSWMLKAKAEVLEGIEKTKALSESEYNALVDDVAKGYRLARTASAGEIAQFASDMKKHWIAIEKAGKKTTKTGTRVAKKTVRKTARKIAKTASRVAKSA